MSRPSAQHGERMRRPDLVRLPGTCFRRERGKAGEAIIVYAISDPDHVLLRRSGMPSYFARYAFKEDRLAWSGSALSIPDFLIA